MASQRRILRSWHDIALIEECIYVLTPFFTIETAYVITDRHKTEGTHFNDLAAAMKHFESEIHSADVHRGDGPDFRAFH